jgi:hypothetical protein
MIVAVDSGHGTRWRLDACRVCPAQTLRVGEFDVCDRPGPATRYDPVAGHRIHTITGLPECVHPFRVQMPAGRYASNGEPAPAPVELQPPDEATDLKAWLNARLRLAPVESMAAAPAEANATANLFMLPPSIEPDGEGTAGGALDRVSDWSASACHTRALTGNSPGTSTANRSSVG